ncbi:hypothetical protein WJX74_010823 [Apatococcus lobatus]|uniref:Uncharacterized protein n=1 Tax=Apatococcus lobatus TaxID=904363 RepID=A0AAW1R321_9CHLO
MACSTWGVTNPRSGRWSDDGEDTLVYGPVPAFGGAVRSEVVQAASSTLSQSESAVRPTADSHQSHSQTQIALSQEQQAQQAREKLASDFRARRLRAIAFRHLRQEQLSTRELMHWGYPVGLHFDWCLDPAYSVIKAQKANPWLPEEPEACPTSQSQPQSPHGSPSESPSEPQPQPQPELPTVAPAPSWPCASALASSSPPASQLPSGKPRRPDLVLYAPAARYHAAVTGPRARLPAATSSQPRAHTSQPRLHGNRSHQQSCMSRAL